MKRLNYICMMAVGLSLAACSIGVDVYDEEPANNMETIQAAGAAGDSAETPETPASETHTTSGDSSVDAGTLEPANLNNEEA